MAQYVAWQLYLSGQGKKSLNKTRRVAVWPFSLLMLQAYFTQWFRDCMERCTQIKYTYFPNIFFVVCLHHWPCSHIAKLITQGQKLLFLVDCCLMIVMSCGLVGVYQCFGGVHHLIFIYLEDRNDIFLHNTGRTTQCHNPEDHSPQFHCF